MLITYCFYETSLLYFMLFGSLSENNGGVSLDNFTVSSSEIRLFSDISGNSIVRFSSIRLASYLTEKCRVMGSEATTFNL